MIKKIFIVLAGIVVVFLLIGFILPAKLEVSKSVSIQAPAASIFEEINNLQRWENWQYWNTLDSEMKINYGEKIEGTGATYSWDGPKMGKGIITITESIPDKSISLDLNFMDNVIAKGLYSLESDGKKSTLNFNFSADQGMNPIARWFNVFMKGEIEKSFEYAGEKIKAIAESKPSFNYLITEETLPIISYVGISHTMSPKDPIAINTQMIKMFTQLDNDLKKAKVKVTGYPFSMYPSYSAESMEMICAMPVESDSKISKYTIAKTESGLAVKGVLKGNYNNLQAIHTEIQKYIQYKKLTESGAPMEVYVTDPTLEKDTVKWITEVYYPVKKN